MELIFSTGKVIDTKKYKRLKELDARVFPNCNNEFKDNRDWWVISEKDKIIAYCGSLYSQGVCIFIRAWVHRDYRGVGLQRKMIRKRLLAAKKKGCVDVITYTTFDNYASCNNLIRCGFKLYAPVYQYAGDVLYWKRILVT